MIFKNHLYVYHNGDRLILGLLKCGKIKLFNIDILPQKESIEMADAIKKFIEDRNIQLASISFVINDDKLIIKTIEVPVLGKYGLDKAINWEINNYVKENMKYYVDYTIIEKIKENEKYAYKIAAFAVPTFVSDYYARTAEYLGIGLKYIDSVSNCILRYCSRNAKLIKKDNIIFLISLGKDFYRIILIVNRVLKEDINITSKNAKDSFKMCNNAAYQTVKFINSYVNEFKKMDCLVYIIGINSDIYNFNNCISKILNVEDYKIQFHNANNIDEIEYIELIGLIYRGNLLCQR